MLINEDVYFLPSSTLVYLADTFSLIARNLCHVTKAVCFMPSSDFRTPIGRGMMKAVHSSDTVSLRTIGDSDFI